MLICLCASSELPLSEAECQYRSAVMLLVDVCLAKGCAYSTVLLDSPAQSNCQALAIAHEDPASRVVVDQPYPCRLRKCCVLNMQYRNLLSERSDLQDVNENQSTQRCSALRHRSRIA